MKSLYLVVCFLALNVSGLVWSDDADKIKENARKRVEELKQMGAGDRARAFVSALWLVEHDKSMGFGNQREIGYQNAFDPANAKPIPPSPPEFRARTGYSRPANPSQTIVPLWERPTPLDPAMAARSKVQGDRLWIDNAEQFGEMGGKVAEHAPGPSLDAVPYAAGLLSYFAEQPMIAPVVGAGVMGYKHLDSEAREKVSKLYENYTGSKLIDIGTDNSPALKEDFWIKYYTLQAESPGFKGAANGVEKFMNRLAVTPTSPVTSPRGNNLSGMNIPFKPSASRQDSLPKYPSTTRPSGILDVPTFGSSAPGYKAEPKSQGLPKFGSSAPGYKAKETHGGSKPAGRPDAATDKYAETAKKQYELQREKIRASATTDKLQSTANRFVKAMDNMKWASEHGSYEQKENAKLELEASLVDHQAASFDEDLKAQQKNQDVRNAGENIQNALDGIDGLCAVIGLKDPKAAKIISASAHFVGSIALAALASNPVTLPLAIVGAIGRLLSAIFGGGPSNAEILEAIQQVRRDLQQLRGEMHRWFSHLSESMRQQFSLQLYVVERRLEQIEDTLERNAKENRQLHYETHDALLDVIKEQRKANADAVAESVRAERKSVSEALSKALNDAGNLKGTQEDVDDLLTKIKDCVKGASTKNPLSKKKPVGDPGVTASKQRKDFGAFRSHAFRDQEGVTTEDAGPSLNKLLNQLDVGFEQIPRTGLVAYCAEAYLSVIESADPLVRERAAAWLKKEGKGLPAGYVSQKIFGSVEKAHEVSKALVKDPSHLKAVMEARRKVLENARNRHQKIVQTDSTSEHVVRIKDAKGDLHGGPLQENWATPTLLGRSSKGEKLIYACDPSVPMDGVANKEEHMVPLPDVAHILEALRPEWINAATLDALSSDPKSRSETQLCLKSARWVLNRKEYNGHFGLHYHWREMRHGQLELNYEVRVGDKTVIPLTWKSPEMLYETRSFMQKAEHLNGRVEHYLRKRLGDHIGNWWSNIRRVYGDTEATPDYLETQLGKMGYEGNKFSGEMMKELFGEKPNFPGFFHIFQKYGAENIFSDANLSEDKDPGKHGSVVIEPNALTAAGHLERKDVKESIRKWLDDELINRKFVDPFDFYLRGPTDKERKMYPTKKMPYLDAHSSEVKANAKAFVNVLKNELANFYQTLPLTENGQDLGGNKLKVAIKLHSDEMTKRLNEAVDTLFASQLKSSDVRTKEEALKATKDLKELIAKIYPKRLEPTFKEVFRGGLLEQKEDEIESWRKSQAPLRSFFDVDSLPKTTEERAALLFFQSELVDHVRNFYSKEITKATTARASSLSETDLKSSFKASTEAVIKQMKERFHPLFVNADTKASASKLESEIRERAGKLYETHIAPRGSESYKVRMKQIEEWTKPNPTQLEFSDFYGQTRAEIIAETDFRRLLGEMILNFYPKEIEEFKKKNPLSLLNDKELSRRELNDKFYVELVNISRKLEVDHRDLFKNPKTEKSARELIKKLEVKAMELFKNSVAPFEMTDNLAILTEKKLRKMALAASQKANNELKEAGDLISLAEGREYEALEGLAEAARMIEVFGLGDSPLGDSIAPNDSTQLTGEDEMLFYGRTLGMPGYNPNRSDLPTFVEKNDEKVQEEILARIAAANKNPNGLGNPRLKSILERSKRALQFENEARKD